MNIRAKVLLVLLSFLIFYSFNSSFSFLYSVKKEKIVEFNSTLSAVQLLLLKDALSINNFFAYDANNKLFYFTSSSVNIEEHQILMLNMTKKIGQLKESEIISIFKLEKLVNDLETKIRIYNSSFENTVDWLQNKFKQKKEIKNFQSEIDLQKIANEEDKSSLFSIFSKIEEQTKIQEAILSKKLSYLIIFSTITLFIIGILLSIFISKLTTQRVTKLSKVIEDFVKSNFTSMQEYSIKISKDEVGQLINNFLILRKEVMFQINFLEENVKERTKEILAQKDKIKEQNEEIWAQNEEVQQKNKLIEKQNSKIIDSIKYAKRIQEALLPPKQVFEEVLPESFVIWQPKALVSGDFYWFRHIEQANLSILAAVDCTGHGVPGGFMSMLGNTLLNEIILRKKEYQPDKILNILRKRIIEMLQPEGNAEKLNDGMDMALILLDREHHKLYFAGAQRPLFLIRNNEIVKIKGDRMPVGKQLRNDNSFSLKTLDFYENDSFYVTSDGFTDQFNKENKRKFSSQRFKQMLLDNQDKSLVEQKNIYESVFNQWKGKTEQTDDVLLIGFKVKSIFEEERKKRNFILQVN